MPVTVRREVRWSANDHVGLVTGGACRKSLGVWINDHTHSQETTPIVTLGAFNRHGRESNCYFDVPLESLPGLIANLQAVLDEHRSGGSDAQESQGRNPAR